MLFVTTRPELLTGAAGNLTSIGSAMAAENAAAAPTTGVVPAAADEVSALIATQFVAHAAAVHDVFVATLGASAGSYAATESANAVAAR